MTELMVIFVIGLVVLGPKRLPELARSLGKSLAEFRRASNDMRREFMSATEDAEPRVARAAEHHAARARGHAPKTDAPPGDPPARWMRRGSRSPITSPSCARGSSGSCSPG